MQKMFSCYPGTQLKSQPQEMQFLLSLVLRDDFKMHITIREKSF